MNTRGDGHGKKKKRPPVFSSVAPQPVLLTDPALANLTDHTEVKVNGETITVEIKDMESITKLGQGQYGVVEKMKHKPSELIFAVKKIRCSMNDKEQKLLLKDLNISMRSSNCPYVVVSYGAMFQGGDIWICMELLDMSLKDFYTKIIKRDPTAYIPEKLLVYIIFCIVTSLEYLHSEIQVIHRDVKPSNMLIDRKGRVKVCDFGISGDLINSMAKTNVGSQPYLAPERINPDRSGTGYSIRSDVWSLGLSILELAIFRFPYSKWNSLFDQLKDVVNSEKSPTLPENSPYSVNFEDFLSRCLNKQDTERATYEELIRHSLLTPLTDEQYRSNCQKEFSNYVSDELDRE